MIKINYCRKCHDAKRLKNIDEVIKDITNIVNREDVEVTQRCASFCGPGKKKYFVTIDGDDIIEADTYEQLLINLKGYYEN